MTKHENVNLSIDFHVHVDERVKYWEIPNVLRARSIDGVGILTHNDFRFAKKIVDKFREKDKKKVYFAGVEIDTADGHLVAYGINQEIPRDRSAEETVEIIRDLGGVSIIPHPLMSHNSIGWKSYIVKADAMEFYNGFAKIFFNFPNYMAEVSFRHKSFGRVGGSDAHFAKAIGTCYTLVDTNGVRTEEEILEALRKHKTIPKIKPIDFYDIRNAFAIAFTPKTGRRIVRF